MQSLYGQLARRFVLRTQTGTGAIMTEPTRYDRIGGYDAIAMVVDRFSDAIVVNPEAQREPPP